jgi:hypothetical protein
MSTQGPQPTGLTHSSLISIGKLCDAGCTATFRKNNVIITKDETTLLQGQQVWRFLLNNNTQTITDAPHTLLQCNSVYQTNNIPALIKFLQAAAFSPVESTWLQAIQKGFFDSWPGITTVAV